jgi:hypothetical protein
MERTPVSANSTSDFKQLLLRSNQDEALPRRRTRPGRRYLMMPPLRDNKADSDAPISEWDRQQAFDRASACEQGRLHFSACGGEPWSALTENVPTPDCDFRCVAESVKHDPAQRRMLAQFAWQDIKAQCIATDDPGLKGN